MPANFPVVEDATIRVKRACYIQGKRFGPGRAAGDVIKGYTGPFNAAWMERLDQPKAKPGPKPKAEASAE